MKLKGIVAIGCLLLVGLAGAGMPEVGDYVTISQSVGIIERITFGTIIDINVPMNTLTIQRDGLMQHSEYANVTYTEMPLENITIGIPTIIAMQELTLTS